MTKILIVDNEKDICDFAVRFLEERNFTATSVTRGSDALKVMERERPDIVLLELEIKDMGGIEILKRMKNLKLDTKVIAVTSADNIGLIEEAKRLGVVANLTKPISLSEFVEVILQNIGKVRRFFKLKRTSING